MDSGDGGEFGDSGGAGQIARCVVGRNGGEIGRREVDRGVSAYGCGSGSRWSWGCLGAKW